MWAFVSKPIKIHILIFENFEDEDHKMIVYYAKIWTKEWNS